MKPCWSRWLYFCGVSDTLRAIIVLLRCLIFFTLENGVTQKAGGWYSIDEFGVNPKEAISSLGFGPIGLRS